jgi:cell division protein FtsL
MTYSSSLAMSRQRYARRGQNAVAFKREQRGFGPVSNTIILIILGCILGLLYLTQVTKTNAFGYKINELRSEASSLQTEHDELEVASARLQSLERAKNSAVSKNMVTVAPSGVVQQ